MKAITFTEDSGLSSDQEHPFCLHRGVGAEAATDLFIPGKGADRRIHRLRSLLINQIDDNRTETTISALSF